MTASETAWACIGAAVGLWLIATYSWDAWHKRHGRFQQTARQAARTEDTVRDELAEAEAALTDVEQRIFDQIIAAEYPKTLPHQRQPRKDQP